ncbi:conserved exported hypothetical protein [Flavobacterium sp. 9AF]|uniref:DUF5723 family protein n=1 Tax=Flavobacterium sp. 9AF TaxID=2653142 RepID=UPI0012F3D47E|nr:DUF5723 family protein [Flavobacterium sp. 9AF]VXC06779.1 conserved exported hypothetical protein [Flavobacterium sp. 9AF]
MLKRLILIVSCLFSFLIQAQSFFGAQHDNYAGIYSVINNPANIVDSRFRTDVNITSGSFFAGSDYYSVKLGDVFSNGDFEEYARKSPTNNNNFYTNIDLLGPSFQMNINDNNAIAFFSRVRGIGHISEIDGLFLEKIENDVNQDFSVTNQNFSIASNSWFEIGLSYARILFNNEKHFIKGGISVKYIGGLYSGYIKARNLSIDYNYTGLEITNTTTTSGEIETGNVSSLENFDDPTENYGNGLGTDIGFTYEFRTSNTNSSSSKAMNKYLLKLGLSITDIGSIKFKEGQKVVYEANASYTDAEYAINDDFDTYYTRISETKSFTVSLPTALHLNADYNLSEKIYINLNTDLNLNKATQPNSNYIKNTLSLAARYESKWISIYLPFTMVENSRLLSGFGFRAGPLTLGSGSLFNGLFGYTNAIDVHFGLKVPIFQNN